MNLSSFSSSNHNKVVPVGVKSLKLSMLMKLRNRILKKKLKRHGKKEKETILGKILILHLEKLWFWFVGIYYGSWIINFIF